MNLIVRFCLSIFIVITVFVVSATVAGLVAEFFGLWKKPIIGAISAACVVFTGYVTAPQYKLICAAIWLAAGAVAAWVLSSVFMYAEDAATQVPLLITYASGVFSLMVCRVWHKRQKQQVLMK
ncbi:hypothetical protein J8M21_00905 [Pseudoalteromonas luteoviolacea]|uniref:hypothetical protein n=1 Tax=Pseudoalteromonas luteoviolacea TaxID=43657 RepID=UPI001B396485|nr:hypothetical protein [Pseudoalteromonas luteoviolacea]MBQ4875759.1 hypothetical protein [Pseudoalteromonas luteoviolacea]MBQ4904794.1 hypothetical protein [Pseudoalteromonas luteoviolacea]